MPSHIYYPVPGQQDRFVELPNALSGYITAIDVDQIAAAKRRDLGREPSAIAVKKTAIRLATQRRG